MLLLLYKEENKKLKVTLNFLFNNICTEYIWKDIDYKFKYHWRTFHESVGNQKTQHLSRLYCFSIKRRETTLQMK